METWRREVEEEEWRGLREGKAVGVLGGEGLDERWRGARGRVWLVEEICGEERGSWGVIAERSIGGGSLMDSVSVEETTKPDSVCLCVDDKPNEKMVSISLTYFNTPNVIVFIFVSLIILIIYY